MSLRFTILFFFPLVLLGQKKLNFELNVNPLVYANTKFQIDEIGLGYYDFSIKDIYTPEIRVGITGKVYKNLGLDVSTSFYQLKYNFSTDVRHPIYEDEQLFNLDRKVNFNHLNFSIGVNYSLKSSRFGVALETVTPRIYKEPKDLTFGDIFIFIDPQQNLSGSLEINEFFSSSGIRLNFLRVYYNLKLSPHWIVEAGMRTNFANDASFYRVFISGNTVSTTTDTPVLNFTHIKYQYLLFSLGASYVL